MKSYPYPVKEGQRYYINLNPGRLFVQQPPKRGKGSRGLFKIITLLPYARDDSEWTKKTTLDRGSRSDRPPLTFTYDLNFQSQRAVVMAHTQANNRGQMPVDSKDRNENKRTNLRTCVRDRTLTYRTANAVGNQYTAVVRANKSPFGRCLLTNRLRYSHICAEKGR